MTDLFWWGYVHVNGSVQVKRYHDSLMDIEDARDSPFVTRVFSPFKAEDREDAIRYIEECLTRV